MAYYLAIDIGASSGRHILATVNDDRLKLEEIYRFENNYISTDDGLCWDIDSLRREVLAGIRCAGELGKIPQTIAIDTWGCDYVLLDENEEILRLSCTSLSTSISAYIVSPLKSSLCFSSVPFSQIKL